MAEPLVKCAYDKLVPTGELKPNPKNYRQHPKKQIQLIGDIIAKTGWRRAVTVSTLSGLIVKGHGAHAAAVARRWGVVPVDYQEYASESEELADLTADNRLAEMAGEDEELLAAIFQGIIDAGDMDLEQTGYKREEIEALLAEVDAALQTEQEGPEIEFSRELLLEHNYVVLYFDNPFDWQVAIDRFGLKTVKDLIPRKGQPTGIGRVLNGSEWLDRIK